MNLEELFNAGVKLMQQRKNMEAAQSFQKYIENVNHPDLVPPNVYFCLGQACENSGQKEAAIKAYKQFADKAANIPQAASMVANANQKALVISQKVGRCGKDHFFFDMSNGLIWDEEPAGNDPYHMLKLPIQLLIEVEKAIAESCFVPGLGQIWQNDFRERMIKSNCRV